MRAGGYYLLLTKILLSIGHYTTDIISSAASSMNINSLRVPANEIHSHRMQ